MANHKTSERVIIVGGGFSGLSAAARLAQAGVPVILLEESDQLGFQASTRNQGWLHSGAAFANERPELARKYYEAMQETLDYCPHCLEPDHEGMYYVASNVETSMTPWLKGWEEAGIPFEEVDRQRFLNDVVGANSDLVQRVYLLPDRAFRPDILLDDLAGSARNAGAEIRVGTHVEKVLIEDHTVCGVLTGTGEEIPGGEVVLSTGALSEHELACDDSPLPGEQPSLQRIALKTNLVSVRPDLSRMPFYFVDWHGLNHVPHRQTSVFQSGNWKRTSNPHDTQLDEAEIAQLWEDIEKLFPNFDQADAMETLEWAGTAVQVFADDQIEIGNTPHPCVIDHGADGGPENLWSICSGRASLWSHLAEDLREKILCRMKRPVLEAARPPWARTP